MKTCTELREQARVESRAVCLHEMRRAAMDWRLAIAPDTYRDLEQRGKDGVHALTLAMSYRDMGRDLGKWAKA